MSFLGCFHSCLVLSSAYSATASRKASREPCLRHFPTPEAPAHFGQWLCLTGQLWLLPALPAWVLYAFNKPEAQHMGGLLPSPPPFFSGFLT